MEASCMQLSIEGERLLKAGDYNGAIDFFEAGLRVGTEDNEVLSAVYNQLGNACFYAGKYHKALEYHKKDLEIAMRLGDRHGQAKAYGNLGNTFKSLKNYPNAVRCCEEHLQITRELGDRLGEGRACYNLGNVHHAMGKVKLTSKVPADQAAGKKSVLTAVEYYKSTLQITAELKDTAGEGRAVGNLGNAYTAIGDYNQAIEYHQRRLKIANDANDQAAKARACGNLGNAYSALGEYSEAIKYYQQSLAVAKDSKNIAGTGQAYYCLGSTYTMLKNWVKAVEFHEQHLQVATEVGDKSGQLRGWYNLRNAYHALGDSDKTIHYHKLIQAAQPNKGSAAPVAVAAKSESSSQSSSSSTSKTDSAKKPKSEKKSLVKKMFKKSKAGTVEAFTADDSDDDDIVRVRQQKGGKSTPKTQRRNNAAEWLEEAVKQSAIEDAVAPSPRTARANKIKEDVMAAIDDTSNSRLNDQRSSAPPPVSTVPANHADAGFKTSGSDEEEGFFDMLVAMQGSRIDDQRSEMPSVGRTNAGPVSTGTPTKKPPPKLDDNMSFFEMLAAAKK